MKIVTTGIMMLAAGALQAQDPTALVQQKLKVISGGTFGFVAEQLVSGTPVKGAPYSAQAVTETTQTLADGNRIVQKSTSTVYRDSLGRERREETLPAIRSYTPQPDVPQIVSISDPVGGVNYSLNSREHVAIKVPANAAFAPAVGDQKVKIIMNQGGFGPGPGAGAVVTYRANSNTQTTPAIEQLGWKLIEGIQVEGTRTTITIPAGQVGNDRPIDIVDEQWRSPDLQVIVSSRHSDPRIGETAYSLTNISRSEPAASLFQVPPDYTISNRKVVLPAR
jgi:hypothetical protein